MLSFSIQMPHKILTDKSFDIIRANPMLFEERFELNSLPVHVFVSELRTEHLGTAPTGALIQNERQDGRSQTSLHTQNRFPIYTFIYMFQKMLKLNSIFALYFDYEKKGIWRIHFENNLIHSECETFV